MRPPIPRRSRWRVAQFDTLRLHLIKLAARIVETRRQILVHLSTACPEQTVLRLLMERIPRLVT